MNLKVVNTIGRTFSGYTIVNNIVWVVDNRKMDTGHGNIF